MSYYMIKTILLAQTSCQVNLDWLVFLHRHRYRDRFEASFESAVVEEVTWYPMHMSVLFQENVGSDQLSG